MIFRFCLELELYRQPGVEWCLIRIGEDVGSRLQVVGVGRPTVELGPGIDEQQPSLIADVEQIGYESKPHALAQLESVIAMQVQRERYISSA